MGNIYRGYEISGNAKSGWTWTDERNFTHYAESVSKQPYATEEAAMDAIDSYKKAQRKAATA